MESLSEDELISLMKTDAYHNKNNPEFSTVRKIVNQAWENLYPDDDQL